MFLLANSLSIFWNLIFYIVLLAYTSNEWKISSYDAYYYDDGEPDINKVPDFGSNSSGDETQEDRDGDQRNDGNEGDNGDQVQREDIDQENWQR